MKVPTQLHPRVTRVFFPEVVFHLRGIPLHPLAGPSAADACVLGFSDPTLSPFLSLNSHFPPVFPNLPAPQAPINANSNYTQAFEGF